jgi:solute carrier family 25 phosphate transporter 23/24/25/41
MPGLTCHTTPQVIRAVPYDAVRLSAYEAYKTALSDDEGRLPVPARLAAGALAGMTSTLVTYPLDTIRFRLAIDPAMKTIPQVTHPPL